MLRCNSVRFSDVVNPTVPFSYILCPTVGMFGAVFQYRKTYGAVRCGAVLKRAKIYGSVPHRTDRKNHHKENPGFLYKPQQ